MSESKDPVDSELPREGASSPSADPRETTGEGTVDDAAATAGSKDGNDGDQVSPDAESSERSGEVLAVEAERTSGEGASGEGDSRSPVASDAVTGGDPVTGGDGAVGDGAPKPVASEPSATRATVGRRRPTFVFFGVVAAVSLLLDVLTKAWAEVYFSSQLIGHTVSLVEGHLSLTLAYNKGGAWGLAHDASDAFRRPFFLFVSVAAIAFIVSLYSRLNSRQHALKWGLPLVLGGALGNLTDRIVRNQVIDFIDYRADWVATMNEWIAGYLSPGWSLTDHWPTFNVADVAICVGVGLMAVDMLTSRRARPAKEAQPDMNEPDTNEPDTNEPDTNNANEAHQLDGSQPETDAQQGPSEEGSPVGPTPPTAEEAGPSEERSPVDPTPPPSMSEGADEAPEPR